MWARTLTTLHDVRMCPLSAGTLRHSLYKPNKGLTMPQTWLNVSLLTRPSRCSSRLVEMVRTCSAMM